MAVGTASTMVTAMEAPTNRVHVTTLTGKDAVGIRVRQNTVVHVSADLPGWAQDAAAGELLRRMFSVDDPCATAELPLDTAVTLPRQRGVRSIRR
jgi:hypothetical protein